MDFDQIKEIFNAIIEWLQAFAQAVEDMFGGIQYGYAGYKTEEEEEEEINLPL